MRFPDGLSLLAACGTCLAALSTACRSDSASRLPRSDQATATAGGREVVAPEPNRDGLIRVLVFYDMEGIAGQDDWRTFIAGMPQYPYGRELLTADLNAVIEGLFAGGADSVEVLDQHGSTNAMEPDVLADRLDRRATIFFRDRAAQADSSLDTPGRYDAVVGVAHHAKTGSRGFASHTVTIGMDVAMNGATVTEVELLAYRLGRAGAPLIMVTGDDKLKADLAGLPWIRFVVTKRSRSADSVDLIPVDEVHGEMRSHAKEAIEQLDQMKAIRLTTPVTVTLRAVEPADLSILRGVPGIAYQDNAVTFTAADLASASQGLDRLVEVARLGWNTVMGPSWQAPGGDPPTEAIVPLVTRWLAVESGRWVPPAPPPPTPPRPYHGSH